jgi:RNA polymerase sigma-70 factor (ECF subfamily)
MNQIRTLAMNDFTIISGNSFVEAQKFDNFGTYPSATNKAPMNTIAAKQSDFEREALPHMNALYSFAVRLCRNREDAHDLVQETFMKGFRFFDKFERGTNCKAWLFRILKNTYINQYRKDKREPDIVEYDVIEEFYDLIRSDSSESTDLQKKIFDNLLDDEVSTALEALPETFRTAIILCDLEGMTYEEIAEIIECPIGTVRSRLHRARKMLASQLLVYAKQRGYDTKDFE